MNKMWSPSVIKSDISPIDLSFNESKISPNIRRINNGGICHFYAVFKGQKLIVKIIGSNNIVMIYIRLSLLLY